MSGRNSLRGLLGVIVLCLTGTVAFAQTGQNFGELVGKAADDQGAALPGVTVTLTGPAVMGAQTAMTNERGGFRFPAVPSGTYKVTFQLQGFATLVRDGVVVPVRQTVTLDAALKVATLQESVTVSGQSPVVDLENAKVGARLDQQTLQMVPTSRSIFGSTTVLPGMVMAQAGSRGNQRGDARRAWSPRRRELQPELLRRHSRHAAELRVRCTTWTSTPPRKSPSTPRRWAPRLVGAAARTSTSSRSPAAT